MLTKQDKNYIGKKMDENRIQFRNEIEPFFIDLKNDFVNHVGAIREDFGQQVRMLAELIQDRPTRSEVKDIVDTAINTHILLHHD